ncbi:MAG: hypothetical protein RLN88_09285 [Ekhidna sp.]
MIDVILLFFCYEQRRAAGVEMLGVDMTEHINHIIDVLKKNREELGI